MSKKIPNPNGRRGNEDHYTLIDKILHVLEKFGLNSKAEFGIKIDDNKKRFADAVGLDENNNIVEIHQVGRTNKDGSPVIRERRAITDIEKATKLKVIFHALMLILVVTIGFWIYQNL